MAFAVGKYAYGVCARCGCRVKYLQMEMERTGFKVYPECFETKPPPKRTPNHVTPPEI